MKGMAIVKCTDTETRAVYIDQEGLEFARQNALARKHRAENEQRQKEAESKRRKAKKAEARRMAYNMATARYLLTRFTLSGVMAAGWAAGWIHPLVSVPLILISLCTASERLGEWRAKNHKKEEKRNG